MSRTGSAASLGDFKEYTSGADLTTWATNLAEWIQVIGAGATVVTTEAGAAAATPYNRTITTDATEPTALLFGPFTALVSMSGPRVRMGCGRPPPIAVPPTGIASGLAILDAGGFTAQTQQEGLDQEMLQNLFSAVGGYIPIPLSAWREVDATGDVGAITANGGVLASDTTPVFDAVATSNEEEILWATGNADPIGVTISLPRDFDDTADAYLDLEVGSGTTNAATLVCASAWSAGAAGAEVSDSTSDTATKSATPHRITVTIDKGDIPAGARRATFRLTPPTHATDTISLYATGVAYKRKLLVA